MWQLLLIDRGGPRPQVNLDLLGFSEVVLRLVLLLQLLLSSILSLPFLLAQPGLVIVGSMHALNPSRGLNYVSPNRRLVRPSAHIQGPIIRIEVAAKS